MVSPLSSESARSVEMALPYPEPTLSGINGGNEFGTHWSTSFGPIFKSDTLLAWSNSAASIDFPDVNVDVNVTPITSPQSSCLFESAEVDAIRPIMVDMLRRLDLLKFAREVGSEIEIVEPFAPSPRMLLDYVHCDSAGHRSLQASEELSRPTRRGQQSPVANAKSTTRRGP